MCLFSNSMLSFWHGYKLQAFCSPILRDWSKTYSLVHVNIFDNKERSHMHCATHFDRKQKEYPERKEVFCSGQGTLC